MNLKKDDVLSLSIALAWSTNSVAPSALSSQTLSLFLSYLVPSGSLFIPLYNFPLYKKNSQYNNSNINDRVFIMNGSSSGSSRFPSYAST